MENMNVFLLSLRLAVICGVYEDIVMVLARCGRVSFEKPNKI